MALIILFMLQFTTCTCLGEKTGKKEDLFLGEQFLQKISNSNRILSICVRKNCRIKLPDGILDSFPIDM